MYNNVYKKFHCPYYNSVPMCSQNCMHNPYNINQFPCYSNPELYNSAYNQMPGGYIPLPANPMNPNPIELRDYGADPFVVNIEKAALYNNNFRTALWTGKHLQLTLMSINVGEDIGFEIHPNLDQFLRIEEGQGIVQMGDSKYSLDFQKEVHDDYVIFVPAGKWHNLTNTGNKPIKLYSIYAPPQHPYGTVHATRADAMAAEENHNH